MTDSLTGMTSLGSITDLDSTKDAQLFQQPMPLSDSSSAIMMDLFGASRTINIKGIYTSSMGTISTFIGQLDALVNGTQPVRTFSCDKTGGTYNVLVQTVRWSVAIGEVNVVNYEIGLTEGSA